jgi:secretion/DNA translocation related CpaE-like protein
MAVRTSQVLIVTGDPDLLDDLLRLTAEVHVVADVAPDVTAARAWYAHAPQVLVGIDAAEACVRAGLPRRAGIVLVGYAPAAAPPDWGVAERLGADHVALLPAAEPWLLERFATVGMAVDTGGIVAVLGGRGGAGASVLAGGLAVTAARRGMRTLLVDADPLGAGSTWCWAGSRWTGSAGRRCRRPAARFTRRRWSTPCRAGPSWWSCPGTGAIR